MDSLSLFINFFNQNVYFLHDDWCLVQDARISALEKEVQTLEDKLLKSKEELTMDDRRDLSLKESPGIKDRQLRFEVCKRIQNVVSVGNKYLAAA